MMERAYLCRVIGGGSQNHLERWSVRPWEPGTQPPTIFLYTTHKGGQIKIPQQCVNSIVCQMTGGLPARECFANLPTNGIAAGMA